jgi:hypothetical protein
MLEEVHLCLNIDDLAFSIQNEKAFELFGAGAKEAGIKANAPLRPGRKAFGDTYKHEI